LIRRTRVSNILFLSHRIPYPPDRGDKIRSWHLLHHLTLRHNVYLGCLFEDPADAVHLPGLRDICAEVAAFPIDRARAQLRLAECMLEAERDMRAVFEELDKGLRRAA